MRKKLLFYNFIAILFITNNNIFLCSFDFNSLLYCTSRFGEHKKNIPKQWNEREVLDIKINGQTYSVSQRIEIEETKVKDNELKSFFIDKTTEEEVEKYGLRQICENKDKLNNYFKDNKDDIISITDKNRQDENMRVWKNEDGDFYFFYIEVENNVVKKKMEDYHSKIDYFLKIEDIPCLFFRKENSDNEEKNLIIFFHGNGESIFNIYDLYLKTNVFSERYDLLIPELPGYPKNKEGDFSEETREGYIENILEFCKTYYSNKRIVIIGYSLGCYFATLLASKDESNSIFKKLIIACPFFTDKTAARNMVKENIAPLCGICCANCLNTTIVNPIYREKLSNEENIKNVKYNIDILYAPNDKVISPKDAESLFNIFKDQKDYNIDVDQDVLRKNGSSQKIRLRPIIPKDFTNEEKQNLDEAILKAVNFEREEKKVENINELNRFFLGEERKVFNRNVGHNDVFLYDQIKYYILN